MKTGAMLVVDDGDDDHQRWDWLRWDADRLGRWDTGRTDRQTDRVEGQKETTARGPATVCSSWHLDKEVEESTRPPVFTFFRDISSTRRTGFGNVVKLDAQWFGTSQPPSHYLVFAKADQDNQDTRCDHKEKLRANGEWRAGQNEMKWNGMEWRARLGRPRVGQSTQCPTDLKFPAELAPRAAECGLWVKVTGQHRGAQPCASKSPSRADGEGWRGGMSDVAWRQHRWLCLPRRQVRCPQIHSPFLLQKRRLIAAHMHYYSWINGPWGK